MVKTRKTRTILSRLKNGNHAIIGVYATFFAVAATFLLAFSHASAPFADLKLSSATVSGHASFCANDYVVFNRDCNGNAFPGTTNGIFLQNNNPSFSRYASVPSAQLPIDVLASHDNGRGSNGSGNGQGKFRTACVYSHFAYDDPIVHPSAPGTSHLHMFFGNTTVDAFTTQDKLVNQGGSSCLGNELNRTGYWTPALLDGKGNAVIPYYIDVYYKSYQPGITQRMPQGLQMIAGEFTGIGHASWTCGGSGPDHYVPGTTAKEVNYIPPCGSDFTLAEVQFPDCWDGQHLGSADHISHMRFIDDNPNVSCPAGFQRLPQLSELFYYKALGDITGYYLSSDRFGNTNATPGSTLHADWWGGWNDQIMDRWINNCIVGDQDCSIGELGDTNTGLNWLQGSQIINAAEWAGPYKLPLP